MTDSQEPPLAPQVPPTPAKDPRANSNPNTNGPYAVKIVTSAPHAAGKEKKANDETADDEKDYAE
jgi:hypothetical protein